MASSGSLISQRSNPKLVSLFFLAGNLKFERVYGVIWFVNAISGLFTVTLFLRFSPSQGLEMIWSGIFFVRMAHFTENGVMIDPLSRSPISLRIKVKTLIGLKEPPFIADYSKFFYRKSFLIRHLARNENYSQLEKKRRK